MSLVAGFGYFLIALGPALTIFVSSIAPKPFLVLVMFTSAFVWLVTLFAISIVWRAFIPLPAWAFLPILITAVALQEFARLQYWHLYVKLEKRLNVSQVRSKRMKRLICRFPKLNYVDRLKIALASGVGHGVVHAVFFGLRIIGTAFGRATYYTQSCKQMPLFLVTALTALAFFLLHTFSMIVTFHADAISDRSQQLFVPVMHLGASLLTLVNVLPNGCTAGVPLVFVCAALTIAYCGNIVWDNVNPNSSNPCTIFGGQGRQKTIDKSKAEKKRKLFLDFAEIGETV